MPKRSEYEQAWEDKPFTVVLEKDKPCMTLACCDCLLVHKFFIKILDNNQLLINIQTDNRATGQLRRHNK